MPARELPETGPTNKELLEKIEVLEVLNKTLEENFVKIGNTKNLNLSFGKLNLEIVGEVSVGGALNHKLGKLPLAVVISGGGIAAGGGSVFYWEAIAITETTFTPVLRHIGAVTATITADWVAVG